VATLVRDRKVPQAKIFLLQIFDERTGRTSVAPMTFWSQFGEKVSKNKEKRSILDAIKPQEQQKTTSKLVEQ
jgi:hypothetical protein